ncbi:Tyrosine recombinase XerC [Azoarcus sp. Aa7]|nr:Tyrosine recombinase XerC [Azoarcus sp. Aa7]
MAGTKYLTYEKKRARFVFQIRVPQDVKPAFDGRTTIRQSLGNISQAEAESRAAALAKHWRAKFDKARRHPAVCFATDAPIVELALDEDVSARAVAAWQGLQLALLHETLTRLRAAPESDWSEATGLADEGFAVARRRLARGHADDALSALETLESRSCVRFKRMTFETNAFAERWNHSALVVAKTWRDVLRGDTSLDVLAVPPDAVLPLTRFFGTRADALPLKWRERLESIGKTALQKTFDKYAGIAETLDEVLAERPVELLRPCDVSDVITRWRERGNKPATIASKLSMLASLLRPLSPAATTICQAAIPHTHLGKARRRPFSDEQLATLHRICTSDEYLHSDDRHLVELMMLTGARLGELLQLHTEQVSQDRLGWTIAFLERDTARLKTAASDRDLPIDASATPELHAWFRARKAAGGRLFPDSPPDKYGHYGNAESKRLNRALRKHFADRRLVLQSIRNTVGQALRRADVDPRVRRRFLGHADIDIHDKHYDPAELLGAADLIGAAPVLADLAARVRRLSRPDDLS